MTPKKERKCSLCFSTEHDKRWHKNRLNLLTVDDITLFVRRELEAWAKARDKYKYATVALTKEMHWSAYLEIISDRLGKSCIIGGPDHLFSEVVGIEYGEYGQRIERRRCVHCGKRRLIDKLFIIKRGDKPMHPPKTQREIKE